MKIRYSFLFVLLFLFLPVNGQTPEKLMLDRIQFSIFPDLTDGDGNQGFPDYFEGHAFMKQVYDSIGVYAKKYFNCHSVAFTEDYGVYIFQNEYPIRTRPYRPRKTSQGSYKVSLTSYLQYASNDKVSDFQMDTRVYITNDRGKNFFDKQSTVPFSITKNPAITSDTMISRQDFLQLYLDGLKGAFAGGVVLPNREYQKPASHYYDHLIQNSFVYTSYVQNNTYYLEDKDRNSIPVLNYMIINHDRSFTSSFSTRVWGDTVSLVDIGTGNMDNLCLEGKISYDMVFDKYSTEVRAYVKTGDSITSSYDYSDAATLSGTFRGNKVEIKWKKEYNTAEFRVNGKFVALLHDLPEQRTLYVDRDRNISIDGIMHLLAAYDFVFMEQQKLNNSPPM